MKDKLIKFIKEFKTSKQITDETGLSRWKIISTIAPKNVVDIVSERIVEIFENNDMEEMKQFCVDFNTNLALNKKGREAYHAILFTVLQRLKDQEWSNKEIAKHLTISTCTVNMFLDSEDNPAIKIISKKPSKDRDVFVDVMFRMAGKYENRTC